MRCGRFAIVALLAMPGCARAPAARAPETDAKPCVFHTEHWHDREPPRLSLRPGARAFAEIDGDSRDVTLTVDGAGARVDITSGLVKLRGFVGAAGVDLYPSRAFDVGGFAVPDNGSSLDWKWSAPGALALSVRAPQGASPRQLETVRACSDLGIEPGSFDPLDAVGGAGLGRLAKLRRGRTVTLASRPGGAPLATVKLEPDQDEAVTVLALEGGAAHVAWRDGTFLLHGWVAASELAEGDKPMRLPLLISMNADHFSWPRPLRVVRCARELALYASQDGEQAPVGTVAGGASIGIIAEGRPYTSVHVIDSTVLALAGAALLVSAADLAACTPPP